jgi:hypothetical protein
MVSFMPWMLYPQGKSPRHSLDKRLGAWNIGAHTPNRMCHITEDSSLNAHCHDNLRSHTVLYISVSVI